MQRYAASVPNSQCYGDTDAEQDATVEHRAGCESAALGLRCTSASWLRCMAVVVELSLGGAGPCSNACVMDSLEDHSAGPARRPLSRQVTIAMMMLVICPRTSWMHSEFAAVTAINSFRRQAPSCASGKSAPCRASDSVPGLLSKSESLAMHAHHLSEKLELVCAAWLDFCSPSAQVHIHLKSSLTVCHCSTQHFASAYVKESIDIMLVLALHNSFKNEML
jgi:hypothetical protein